PGEHVEPFAGRGVVVEHRADRACLEVPGERVGHGPGADVGELGATAGPAADVDPDDVPPRLGAARVAAHARGVRGRVLDAPRRAPVQGERVADLGVAGAVRGDIARVRAGAEAVQRVAD